MSKLDQHITKLIGMLDSPNASTRYEACEYLRAAPEISIYAIRALEKAVNDPDLEVAVAAKRALNIHKPESAQIETPSTTQQPEPKREPASPYHIQFPQIPNSSPNKPEYIFALEKRIMVLEVEIQRLNDEFARKKSLTDIRQVSLPDTAIVSDDFLKRAFAIWGHMFVAQLIISTAIGIIMLILGILPGLF